MKRTIFILFIIIFSISNSFACDCKSEPVSQSSISKYELIFVGKVIAISGCDEKAKVNFSVQKLFRGKCFPSTDVEFDCSSDCQMSFVPGQTWIIYATYEKYGEPKVQFCSFSRQQFSNENEDYNTVVHGLSFVNELQWLEKNFGVQKMNEIEVRDQQHHENLRPEGYSFLWYYVLSLIGLLGIYFVTKKYLK